VTTDPTEGRPKEGECSVLSTLFGIGIQIYFSTKMSSAPTAFATQLRSVLGHPLGGLETPHGGRYRVTYVDTDGAQDSGLISFDFPGPGRIQAELFSWKCQEPAFVRPTFVAVKRSPASEGAMKIKCDAWSLFPGIQLKGRLFVQSPRYF